MGFTSIHGNCFCIKLYFYSNPRPILVNQSLLLLTFYVNLFVCLYLYTLVYVVTLSKNHKS